MRFEIYESFLSGCSDGVTWEFESTGWWWHLVAANNRIIADGAESYASRRNVIRAINRLASAFIKTGHRPPIVEVEA
jgi:uncharacterized protein YegP (UPF0339 family)